MAKQTTDQGRSELGEVHITIVVAPGRVRPTLKKLPARSWLRLGLAFFGLAAAVAAATISVASRGARLSRQARQSPGIESPQPADRDAVIAPFGIRVECPRLTVVSSDGAYARVDFERSEPCGTYGNYVTLILHHEHGVWVREFEATGWRCSTNWLPRRALVELQICPRTVTPTPPAGWPLRSS